MEEPAKYKRVLLKLSGEAFQGNREFGIDSQVLERIAKEIAQGVKRGVEVALVVGGGNFFRGSQEYKALGIDRVTADYMGMLATLMNSLALQDILEKQGVATRVMCSLETKQVAEPYIRRRAIRHLEKGRVVIFAAGLGSPFFTTDTTAALRAIEIGADMLLKATKVDGVYNKDPVLYSDAFLFEHISYMEVITKGLKVMDSTAITLCMENGIPIQVFNINVPGNTLKAICGERVGTLVG